MPIIKFRFLFGILAGAQQKFWGQGVSSISAAGGVPMNGRHGAGFFSQLVPSVPHSSFPPVPSSNACPICTNSISRRRRKKRKRRHEVF